MRIHCILLLLCLSLGAFAGEPPAPVPGVGMKDLKPGELTLMELPEAGQSVFVRLPRTPPVATPAVEADPPPKPTPGTGRIANTGAEAAAPRWPVFIFLHGMTNGPDNVRSFVDLLAQALTKAGDGMILWAPLSPSLGWRDEDSEATQVRKGLAALLKAHPADPARMVVTGFSRGGIFGSRLVFGAIPKSDLALLPPQGSWPTPFAGYGSLVSFPSTGPSAKGWQGFPALLIAASRDRGFPADQIDKRREEFRTLGLTVSGATVEGRHTLTPAVCDQAMNWANTVFAASPPAKAGKR